MTTPVNKKEGGGQVKNNQNPVQVVNIFHELYSILAIVWMKAESKNYIL